MNMDPLFELTASTQLNELINKARELYSGDITDSQFKDCVKTLNQFRRDFRSFLRQQLKYTPLTALVDTESNNIEKNLENLRSALEIIYLYFSDGDKSHIENGIMKCKEIFKNIQISIDAIQKQDAETPKYSDVPVQNEIMRIGFALNKGQISADIFSEKINSLINSLKKYSLDLDKIEPAASEREYYANNKEEIKSLLKEYINGLTEAGIYLTDRNVSHLDKGFEQSKKAAEKLILHQNNMSKQQEYKLCIKCGAQNSFSDKICCKCSAVMPVFNIEPTETLDFEVNEHGEINASSHSQTELTQNISKAVADFRNGKKTHKEFAEIIEKTLSKVKQAQKDKEKIQIPDSLQGQHEASPLFLQIEELIQTGFEDTIEGLQKLSLYANGDNESNLIFGLEEFLSGADRLSQAQKLSIQSVQGEK